VDRFHRVEGSSMSKAMESLAAFEKGFREIQGEFRKYYPLSILDASLGYLYAPSKNKQDKAARQPWLVLLLIKWVYSDELANSFLPRPSINSVQYLALLQKVLDLTDSDKMPDEYEEVRLFMRALAYQQFFYQAEGKLVDLARQEIIFSRVPSNHYFKTRFLKLVGLPIETFLRISFVLLAAVESQGRILSRDYLFALCPPFEAYDVDAYLRAISIDVNDLNKALRDADTDGRSPEEFLHQTPFLKFPLVKVDGKYWCVSPAVLSRSLGHFVFDLLKSDDVNAFNNPFGKSFEKYVGEWLKKTKLPIAIESELIKELPGVGGVIDFLIADDESNVLIDAKGVEMAQGGMAAVRKMDMRRAVKTSLIKAFEQGHEVISRLPKVSVKNPVICQRANNYLLVVTYKELYVGNGMAFANVVGGAELDKVRSAYSSDHQIPIENMYFLTIHEFEELMDLVSAGRVGLVEFLEYAKQIDSNPRTQKFNFEMHIQEFSKKGGRPIPLLDILKEMREEISERFSES
jgi:hypothetical protein